MILAPIEDYLLNRRSVVDLSEDFEPMHRNGLRLLRQINTLLDLAKADAGQLRLRVGEMSINKLVENTFRNFRPVARRKDLSLSFVPLTGDDTIVADSEKLDLAVSNLVANAVKFTPQGDGGATVEDDDDWVSRGGQGHGDRHSGGAAWAHLRPIRAGRERREPSFEGAGYRAVAGQGDRRTASGLDQGLEHTGQGSEFHLGLRRRGTTIPPESLDRRRVSVPTSHARRAEDRDQTSWLDFDMDGEAWVSVEPKPSRPPAADSSPVDRRSRVILSKTTRTCART